MEADKSPKSHFRLMGTARTGLPGRVPNWQQKHPRSLCKVMLHCQPLQTFIAMSQSGAILTLSMLGFWVRRFVLMATTEKTRNPLPSAATYTPSGHGFLAETWPESATPVPGARGCQDLGGEG